MRLLIDGYNLLFQSPFVGRGRGPGWLERSRNQLVRYLHTHVNTNTLASTVIVFDASQVGETKGDYRTNKGVSILFSRLHFEADDLLEEIIRKHSSPKSLTVVSSDHRIQKCAKARRATIVSSNQFLGDLGANRWSEEQTESRESNSQDIEIGKNEVPLTEDQINYWLDEFNQ